jgi:uncharacterized membrane protein YeaQ/YmgE (transglycosylase-associated protein family)
MNVITWFVIGGLVGWLASVAMQIDAQEKIFLNVAIGIVGAVFSGWYLTPLVGIAAMNQGGLSMGGVFVAFLGAVVILAIVNLVRHVAVGIKW